MRTKINQKNSQPKHAQFASRLIFALNKNNIEPKPKSVADEFNKYSRFATLKPHTVRKWLLGISRPRIETLNLLAEWLELEPCDRVKDKQASVNSMNKVSFEFDFTDQEVISKYLAMSMKEKVTVRLVIDAIADNHK